MCAMSSLLLGDAGDFELRQFRAEPLTLLVTGLVLVFLDDDLGSTKVVQDLRRDGDLVEFLLIVGDGIAIDEEDGSEAHRVLRIARNAVDHNDRADLDLFLTSACANNRINHDETCLVAGKNEGALETLGELHQRTRIDHVWSLGNQNDPPISGVTREVTLR